jgi:hypothetical protein
MVEQVTLVALQVVVVIRARTRILVDQLVQPRLLLMVEEETSQMVEVVVEATTISRPQERLHLAPRRALHALPVQPR